MNYIELRSLIRENSNLDFAAASNNLQSVLFDISRTDVLSLITEIGIIPEDIGHDSSEEKLYTKVSDILFAKALKEMNFEVTVLRERSNCADIIAQSKYHNYSLVGDAKAFRLSRTAKNAKDFKVDSMVHWKEDNDFSVLACPYFQYPKSNSQIYRSALNGNVSLFSWEYLYIILSENIRESEDVNLRELWNQSHNIMQQTNMADANKCFIQQQDANIREIIGLTEEQFNNHFNNIKGSIVYRGNEEIRYYESEIARIQQLNREDAIRELLISMKLDSKIETIRRFINQVQR
ncbi:HindIII family type II restriction endonuclease [uncultured Bacteroides sp.]|jgi:HindIII restriction endonuclease.|uniref:HindIII family type II restriction endonuclease n=1 Tax=uncultured Bacteroides sp. TaxID=162156 RepID=UPI0026028EDA|nr:HindIII family type II restriction endonuclease [uncultured Bacteroides sp.]